MRCLAALRILLLMGAMSAMAPTGAQEIIHEVAPEVPEPSYAERMAREHADDYPVASRASMEAMDRGVGVTRVTFGEWQGRPLRGYLALPRDRGAASAGVLVHHEWWGLNANIEAMTRMLAAQGYAALAVDFYDGQTASTPEQARELMSAALSDPLAREAIFRQSHHYLRQTLRIRRVGVIGWCFGGTMSYEAAIALSDRLQAAVIYYGQVGADPETLGPLTAPVLGLFGGADQGIPVASVKAFEHALTQLGRAPQIHIYEGAGHAFANPSGRNYEAEPALQAWRETKAFLAAHLQPDAP